MEFKIEKVPVKSKNNSPDFRSFVMTLQSLKVGESFLFPQAIASNYRMAIVIVEILLNVHIITRTEGKSVRVARVN